MLLFLLLITHHTWVIEKLALQKDFDWFYYITSYLTETQLFYILDPMLGFQPYMYRDVRCICALTFEHTFIVFLNDQKIFYYAC